MTILKNAITALLYMTLARGEYFITNDLNSASMIWWPAGWAFLAVFRWGSLVLPGVFLGEFLIAQWFNLPPLQAAMTGMGNSVEAAIAVGIIRKRRFNPRLESLSDISTLLMAASLAPMAIWVFQSTAYLSAGWIPLSQLARNFAIWWTSDSLAIFFCALAFMTIPTKPTVLPRAVGKLERLLGVSGLVLATSLTLIRVESGNTAGLRDAIEFVVGGPAYMIVLSGFTYSEINSFKVAYVPVVAAFLIWSAIRFSPRGTTILLMLFAFTVMIIVWNRWSVFDYEAVESKFPFYHSFMGVSCLSTLLLSAALTERRKTEVMIRERRHLEGMAVLSAGIAHDFNNLMTVILGYTSILQDSVKRDDPNLPMYDAIHSASMRASDLTKKLLASSGIGFQVRKQVDLRDTTMRCVNSLQRQPSIQIRMECRLTQAVIVADPILLGMTIENVLLNAVEACQESGRVQIELIETELAQSMIRSVISSFDPKPGPAYCLSIEDDGKGMDDKTRLRVFDPFFSTKFAGRGLGMAAARGVIHSLGGMIVIESTPKKGTKVELYFPLNNQDQETIQLQEKTLINLV
jgi:signal transduction histidine kinase